MSDEVALSTGATMRVTHPWAEHAVVCVNGGRSGEVPGTWSATLEWLVTRLAPRFPDVCFAEVRYRIKSWRALDSCIEDGLAAIEKAGRSRTLLLGFSMGGAVAVTAANDARVTGVLGLAPWIPDRLELTPLAGKRLDVLHGSLDRWLPGIPGVSPVQSRHAFERARALGVPGSYTLIHGGVHGTSLRSPGGRLVPLPRAAAWTRLVGAQLDTFVG